ncbi:carbamoyl-phosphate synthase [Synechococcus sp. AH-601-N10]|nr:carbamoyl-phosphate synthase [Synechococcus sp. AH-601-N10]
MLRRLYLGLLASAISVAALPAIAQEGGSADDLGVMSINLQDVVKPTFGFQGALQGAGTPNQAGIGGFLPLSVGDNSVWFLDVLANANFSDYSDYSSLINTEVAGTTISTSSRLGYRWLNGDRSWMYGLNAGYDSRPMNSGGTDTGIPTFGTERSAFFQQVAVNAEAVSNDWNFNAYALLPIGDTNQQLNWFYQAGALDTYGLDVGYFITPELNASVGYYYQSGDYGYSDGSGVLGRVAYEVSSGLTAGVNISYDEAYETRVSADLKVRFGGPKTTSQRKEVQQQPVINALTISPENRDVRIHDGFFSWVANGVDDVVDGIESVADEASAEAQDFLRTKAGRDLISLYVGNEDWLDADLDVLAEACVDGLCEAAAL